MAIPQRSNFCQQALARSACTALLGFTPAIVRAAGGHGNSIAVGWAVATVLSLIIGVFVPIFVLQRRFLEACKEITISKELSVPGARARSHWKRSARPRGQQTDESKRSAFMTRARSGVEVTRAGSNVLASHIVGERHVASD